MGSSVPTTSNVQEKLKDLPTNLCWAMLRHWNILIHHINKKKLWKKNYNSNLEYLPQRIKYLDFLNVVWLFLLIVYQVNFVIFPPFSNTKQKFH